MFDRIGKRFSVDHAREAWLQERRTGLGGTDAAAILGVAKYQTAFDIWLDKTGQKAPVPSSEAMWWGSELEALIARRYTEKTGNRVFDPGALKRDEEFPFLFSNADRLLSDHPRGLEIKTASAYLADEWGESGTDEIPSAYLVQCQHYLMVHGFRTWDVAVLIGGQDVRFFQVRADDDFISVMRERLVHWWNEHIVRGVRPEIDGGQGARDFLARRFPRETGPRIPSTPEIEGLVNRLKQARWAVDHWSEIKAATENELKLQMAQAEGIDGADWRITWKATKARETTDWELVATDLGKALIKSMPQMRDLVQSIATLHTSEKAGVRRFLLSEKRS